MSPRFPFVTPVMESFSSDLVQAIVSYWAESYLESCGTSMMELFCENSQWPKDLEYFGKKAPLQMFEEITNAPSIGKVL